jgi:uncharacterized protein YjbK
VEDRARGDPTSRGKYWEISFMATKVTERKRKAFEGKIEGSDKVEIKITVAKKDEARAYETLEIERREAARRSIYFFDTPDLAMNKAGIVLRARAIEDDDHDSVVKIRPVNPQEVDEKWRDTEGFKIEADAVGDKVVMSASLKAKQKKNAIDKVADGKDNISDLFSKSQKKFLDEFHDGPLELDDLAVLGPVRTLRADIERAALAYELTAEYWTLPNDSHLLELSIKCPPEEAVVAREVFQAFLAGHGLDPNGAQATKTNLALKTLTEQIKT